MTASSPVATELGETPAASLPHPVTARLEQTWRRVMRIRWVTALGGLAVLALALISGVALADFALELPLPVRAATFATLLATLAAGLWWYASRSIHNLTLSKTAAETEAQLAQFGQRLRTTLAYEQRPAEQSVASPRLLTALHNQTAQLAGQVDWEAVVDDRPALLALGGAAVALVGWGLALALVPEYRTATARALLLPAEYSQVDYSPHEQTVRYGGAAELEVTISGRPIHSAVVRHRPAGSDAPWTTIDLSRLGEDSPTPQPESAAPAPPTALSGTFHPRLEQLERDLEIEVLAGPRELPRGRITVLQPLKLARALAHITPPAYTGRPPESVTSDSVTGLEARVLEGSHVDLRLELNRPAVEAALLPLRDPAQAADPGADSPEPASIPLSISGNTLVGSLRDLRQNVAYGVSAQTADGMTLDPTTIRIRVQADRKPVVRFLAPAEEVTVTPTTEVPVLAEASDDLGLHAVGIQYQVNAGELRTLWEGSGDGSTETLRALANLLLEDLNVTFRDSVAYFAYAEDNYFGQPRRTTTELRFIDIRPYKVEYQLSAGGGGGGCDGTSASLEELVRRQRKNLVAAFGALEQQPVSAETAATLRDAEADLQRTTHEFAQALQSRFGPVPSLGQATAAMEAAVASLGQRELPDGVAAERQALAHLMQARENLRQMLKNSNSQQASACRNFDREFRQSLRLPERKQDTPENRLAEARTQLQQLAQRERNWGQQARQSCQSPSSSSSASPSANPRASQSSGQKPSQSPSPSERPPAASNPAGEPQPSNQSPSNPAAESSPSTPSAEELAQAQSKLRQELADLKRHLADQKAAGRAAPQQVDHADEAMQRGLEQLAAGEGDGAAQAAEESAEQIEALADHLAALATRDFGQRLDDAHEQARQIAQAQAELARALGAPESSAQKSDRPSGRPAGANSGSSTNPTGRDPAPGQPGSAGAGPSPANEPSGPAGDRPGTLPGPSRRSPSDPARAQRQLATRMDLLTDVLAALRAEASAESPALRRQLDTATSETPPDQIAAEMRQAAQELAAQRPTQAAQSAAEARDDLQHLAQTLGAARGAFAQPQLQELLALEEQLAQLLKQAERAEDPRTAEVTQKWQTLADRLDRLATGDRRLADALDKAAQPPSNPSDAPSDSPPQADSGGATGTSPGGNRRPRPGANPRPGPALPNGPQEVAQGHHVWITLPNGQGAREIARVLQTKIQEAILAGALLDSDQPVPPEYKPLVEKYYKTLSDDLR